MSDRHPNPCRDCRLSTTPKYAPGEWYMVYPDVWTAAGLGPYDGYLCIGCLEKRLGRRLRPYDFTDAPVNNPMSGFKSKRLRQRLSARRDVQIRYPRWDEIEGQQRLWEPA